METSIDEDCFDHSNSTSNAGRHGLGYSVLYEYQGTNWLKALAFAIVNRSRYPIFPSSNHHPLLTISPHDLVPFVDFKPHSSLLDYTEIRSTRRLPLCRWKMLSNISAMEFQVMVRFGIMFLDTGKSLKNPHKVLFLKYEDLKKEPEPQLKKLAEFLGYGFSIEEESQGMIKAIGSFCSFQHLKSLDVNKNENVGSNSLAKKDFFRKGEVGDWKNYLTPIMVERLDRLMEVKLHGSGLTFQNCIP
ncbi:hypothetical protein MKW92_026155 [Papaver armeniacum]|nr:hypothetical protein MKW92_026155 [Papaver armeniacum]